MRSISTLALVTTAALVAASPGKGDGDATTSNGVRYEPIGEYSIERLNTILTKDLAGFSSFPVNYPPTTNAVKLYRVRYKTVIPELGNRPVTASGLVAVPKVAAKKLLLVSYQHGTVFSRIEVPSHPEESMETRLMVARFGGQGYLVIAADYVGKGESDEPDSYLVKECTAQACLDMLLASRAVCADLKIEQGPLFLSGWSQGAWCTMVFRKKLESLKIEVRGAATASTPNDVYALLTRWINAPSSLDARYLVGLPVLFIHSYEQYYRLPGLSRAAIKPRCWQVTKDLYANRVTWEQAEKLLPATVKELLQPEFAAASSLAGNRLFELLQDNQAYRWRSLTPSRFYYGKVDEVVPPYVATLPVEYEKTLGGATTEAVYAGDKADHRGTFVFGVLDQKAWFDGLANK